jgi:hypothetical protein
MLPPDFQRKEVYAPPLQLDQSKRASFDHLLSTAIADPSRPIQYNCAYPKYEFLMYLAVYHPVVLHGSNNPAIAIFEPRLTTDWAGRPLQAVYAAADGIWPMFFFYPHDGWSLCRDNAKLSPESFVQLFPARSITWWFTYSRQHCANRHLARSV